MKLLQKSFRIFKWKNRWIIPFIGICVSSVFLFLLIPQENQKYSTWDDRCIGVLEIAQGKLADICGKKTHMAFPFLRVLLPIFVAWGAIEIVIRTFFHFFTWTAICRFRNRHIIVCGLGEKGFTLVKELLNRNHTVVAVDRDASNPYLEQVERRGGFTFVGDATDVEFLKTLGVHRAAAFYAMTGDDTVNIKCALSVKEYFQDKTQSCWYRFWGVLFGYINEPFSAMIQVHDTVLRRLAWEKNGPFSYESLKDSKIRWECYPMSAYDEAARKVVEKFPPDKASSVGNTKPYHIVIVGFGWFGERVALQTIRMCQQPLPGGQKTVIHIIDNQADFHREQFYQRYPAVDPANKGDERYGGYAPLADLRFIQGDILRMNEKAVRDAIPDIDEQTVIYICLADELTGAEAAMSLAGITQDSGTRIVFALPETQRLTDKMRDAFAPYGIKMFFPLSASCTLAHNESQLGKTIDAMAKAVFRTYHHFTSPAKAEIPWSQEPEWSRESNRQVAAHVFFKLRLAELTSEQIKQAGPDEIISKCKDMEELLAEAEHDRWSAERLLNGWTYDAVRNNDKRQHPDIQPLANIDPKKKNIDPAINSIIPEVVRIWQKAEES